MDRVSQLSYRRNQGPRGCVCGLCKRVCTSSWTGVAASDASIWNSKIWSQHSWADQVSKSSPWQFSYHIHEHMHTHGDTRRPLLFVWALTAVLFCSDVWFYLNAFCLSVLTGNTGSPCYRLNTVAWSPSSLASNQASKFSSPLTSCNNLCTPTSNIALFFFLLYGLQLDAMLNWEKNSLQTHIHCYVSPIFNQAER